MRYVPAGSSPLARGTPTGWGQKDTMAGLIPARAGNTIIEESSSTHTGAHPRSRGEHLAAEKIRMSAWGSSPLARGAHPQGFRGDHADGLIPARAGST